MREILMLIIKFFNASIKILAFSITFLLSNEIYLYAEEKIEVFPSNPYDQFIVYQTLIIFWIGIIGLIIILKMKLKELERIQNMGIHREEKDIPFLD